MAKATLLSKNIVILLEIDGDEAQGLLSLLRHHVASGLVESSKLDSIERQLHNIAATGAIRDQRLPGAIGILASQQK